MVDEIKRKQTKGIDFMGDPYGSIIKPFAGELCQIYVAERGSVEDWRTKKNEHVVLDRTNDQFPGIIPKLQERHAGEETLGQAILKRGVFCLSPEIGPKYAKNELARFKQPDLAPTYNQVRAAILDEKKVFTCDDLRDAQQRRILLAGPYGNCVYCLAHDDYPREVRVGKTRSLDLRINTHMLNQNTYGNDRILRLTRVWSTQTYYWAGKVERRLINFLRKNSPSVFVTSESYFETYLNNALEVIDSYMESEGDLWFRNTSEVPR